MRVIIKALALMTGGLLFTGCTAPTDPFVSVVKEAVAESSFEETNQMASGCIGVYLFCSQPMYEPVFFAPDTVPASQVCDDFIGIAKKLGLVAYGLPGYDAYKFPEEGTDVSDLCTRGLGSPLKNPDGSDLYQGLVLFDDGANDGFGKVYSLNRGPTEFGTGYSLIISFSKDLNRVGYISYGSEKPKLLTQADLDSANQANTVAAETMNFAIGLIGLPEKEAREKANANGYSSAIYDIDGVEQSYEQKYDPRRILFAIRTGKVFDVLVG